MAEEGIRTNFSNGGGRKCSYYGCQNTTKNCNLAFFSIPFKSRGDYDRYVTNNIFFFLELDT